MKRVCFLLGAAEYAAARCDALRLGISLTELFRRSLRAIVPVDESKPWMCHAGSLPSKTMGPRFRGDD